MPILPPQPPVSGPSAPGGSTSFKYSDICTRAMKEIGSIDPAEVPTGPELADVAAKGNSMLDSWNADGKYIYASQFVQYVLTAGLQPHTIGPSGTFVVAQRPIKILGANIILNPNAGPNQTRSPIAVRDKDWWLTKRAFAVQGTLPTDVYYEEDWPNGSLFFWIVPNVADNVELETWTILSQLQLTDQFSMPPGYLDAVVYSLAEAICPMFGKEVSPTIEKLKVQAEKRIWAPNLVSPRMGTNDVGIPRGDSDRPRFNYLTGMSR